MEKITSLDKFMADAVAQGVTLVRKQQSASFGEYSKIVQSQGEQAGTQFLVREIAKGQLAAAADSKRITENKRAKMIAFWTPYSK